MVSTFSQKLIVNRAHTSREQHNNKNFGQVNDFTPQSPTIRPTKPPRSPPLPISKYQQRGQTPERDHHRQTMLWRRKDFVKVLNYE